MITYVRKSVFNIENVEAIVNTVNCEGFMGAGLAYEFSLRYPEILSVFEYDQTFQGLVFVLCGHGWTGWGVAPILFDWHCEAALFGM